eukprot:3050973-Lingulodinium_polyedra.AAC.1
MHARNTTRRRACAMPEMHRVNRCGVATQIRTHLRTARKRVRTRGATPQRLTRRTSRNSRARQQMVPRARELRE